MRASHQATSARSVFLAWAAAVPYFSAVWCFAGQRASELPPGVKKQENGNGSAGRKQSIIPAAGLRLQYTFQPGRRCGGFWSDPVRTIRQGKLGAAACRCMEQGNRMLESQPAEATWKERQLWVNTCPEVPEEGPRQCLGLGKVLFSTP